MAGKKMAGTAGFAGKKMAGIKGWVGMKMAGKAGWARRPEVEEARRPLDGHRTVTAARIVYID